MRLNKVVMPLNGAGSPYINDAHVVLPFSLVSPYINPEARQFADCFDNYLR